MIKFLLILLIVSGAIAFIGNYIGRYFGKKRLTIFNLRPRYTATAFTIFSGILIAIITLVALLIISQDARTAFFGLEKLKEELRVKTWERDQIVKEIDKTKEAIESTKKEIGEIAGLQKNLEKQIRTAREGVVLFRAGEPLITRLLEGGEDQTKALKNMLTIADAYVRRFGVQSEKHLIYITPEDFDDAVQKINNMEGNIIVRLLAANNTTWGEVVNGKFEIYSNTVIFKKNEEIVLEEIDPKIPQDMIELKLRAALTRVHTLGSEKGILKDAQGSIGNVPYSDIFETAKKIKRFRDVVVVRIIATKDIYTFGPLEVNFKITRK